MSLKVEGPQICVQAIIGIEEMANQRSEKTPTKGICLASITQLCMIKYSTYIVTAKDNSSMVHSTHLFTHQIIAFI